MLPEPLFLNIQMYGIMIAIGILFAYFILFFLTKKKQIHTQFTDFIFYSSLISIAASIFSAAEKGFKHNLSLYLISYGIFRYFLEYLRGDNRGELIVLITPSQFWSLLMILLGIILIFVIKNLYQRNGK